MDEERRHHPLGSKYRPQDVVLLQQEKEGGQVCQNIRQAQNHIKECEFKHCSHSEKGLLESCIIAEVIVAKLRVENYF